MTTSFWKFILPDFPRKCVIDGHWFFPIPPAINEESTGERTCSMTCATKLLQSQGVNVGMEPR